MDTIFITRKKKINHLIYMNNIKMFAKNEKELEALILVVKKYSEYSGIWIDIE